LLMSSRFLAFALVALMLVLGASSVALTSSVYAQGDDRWYPGEGVKQNMYVKYEIQEEQTNDRQPFELTLYFQEQNQDGEWTVPAFVVDEGKVIEGTFKLSDSMAYLAGSSQVPEDMNDFVGGYSGSLHWLDAFTTKGKPLSLTQASWGKTASIGGSEVKPAGPEKVTVPAGTYDTTVILWHKSVDSKVWIWNEFPFPIKAVAYADVTTGTPPIQFSFELLETGMGKPTPPASEDRVPTPPLSKKTGRGTYEIVIDWEPPSIEPGTNVLFTVSLKDDVGFPLERANYDFTVKSADGSVVQEFKNQNADSEFGTGTHEVQLDSAGPMTITVKINAVGSREPSQFTESADFNVVVVPEFPVSAAIVAAAVIGLVVVMTRARGTGLGSLFGSKGSP
jgi:hypothetical protein